MPIALSRRSIFKAAPLDNENGLVGSWSFCDGTANDVSGSNNHGTLSGTTKPYVASGPLGSPGLLFDGSTSWISIADNAALRHTAVSGFCWVNFTSLSPAYTGVIVKNTPATAFYALYVKSNGKLALYHSAGGSTNSYDGTGTNTLTTGKPYHLVFTIDAGGLKGYVNGALDESASVTNAPSSANTAALALGQDPVNAGRFFNGVMGAAGIANCVWSPGEVNAMYNQGLAGYQNRPDEWEMPALLATSSAPTFQPKARYVGWYDMAA